MNDPPPALAKVMAPRVALRLFVASGTPQAASAIDLAARLRREQLGPDDQLEVIDVVHDPESAGRHGVVALPTLLRVDVRPHPAWVGNLWPFPPVLRALGLVPRLTPAATVPVTRPAIADVRWDQPDAWIVDGPDGKVVATWQGTDEVFRDLAWTAELGLATMSDDGLVLFANPRMSELLGVPHAQLLASTLWEHLRPLEAASLQQRVAQMHDEHLSDTVHSRASDERQMHLTLSPLHGRSGMRIGVVLQDLNTWRKVLAHLESQQERLEALVAERTWQLRQMLSQAEAGQRAKSVFLSKMSHEIRTPLNAILGFTHLLLREIDDPSHCRRLQKMEQAGQHLLTLLTDILDLARIEAEHVDLHLSPLDAAAVVRRVQAMVADAAAGKGLRLTVGPIAEVPPILWGDGPRIAQCLLNLVYNAVKFTEQGEVEIRARLAWEDAESAMLRFEVDDTGPGVSPALAERLFAPFEQGSERTAQQQGSGLGLAITRGLARAMGGDCGVEGRAEGGSRFWFSVRLVRSRDQGSVPVPTGSCPAADQPPALEEESALQALRSRHAGNVLLVVEDNLINREVAVALMQAAGLGAIEAEDGDSALCALARHPGIALVLLDMEMPGLTGPETAQKIRQDLQMTQLPIIALTANAFEEDRRACLQAGMDDFLSKPVDPDRLYRTVLRWLDSPSRAVQTM